MAEPKGNPFAGLPIIGGDRVDKLVTESEEIFRDLVSSPDSVSIKRVTAFIDGMNQLEEDLAALNKEILDRSF